MIEENMYQRMRRQHRESFLRERRNHVRDLYYGAGNWSIVAGQVSFKHVLDDDTIILGTLDVKKINDNPVLIVGGHSAVYLKDFNVRPVKVNGMALNLVKLQRDHFKVYKFKRPFDGYGYATTDLGFDDLVDFAREQDRTGIAVWE